MSVKVKKQGPCKFPLCDRTIFISIGGNFFQWKELEPSDAIKSNFPGAPFTNMD